MGGVEAHGLWNGQINHNSITESLLNFANPLGCWQMRRRIQATRILAWADKSSQDQDTRASKTELFSARRSKSKYVLASNTPNVVFQERPKVIQQGLYEFLLSVTPCYPSRPIVTRRRFDRS